MRYMSVAFTLAVLLTASANAQTTNPKALKSQLNTGGKAQPAGNPQCKLFTPAEIAAYAGAPVGPGESAAGGLGCNWHAKDYSVSATVSVVPPDYFPEPDQVKGFKRLPDLGKKAWVAPDSGWSAGAIVQDVGVVVVVSGKASTEASAVALLKEAIKRRK